MVAELFALTSYQRLGVAERSHTSIGGAEESDARSVRKEERPELENLVVLGKGLRWSSAFSTGTGNEECRKKRKQPISVSNLQEFGVTKEMG